MGISGGIRRHSTHTPRIYKTESIIPSAVLVLVFVSIGFYIPCKACAKCLKTGSESEPYQASTHAQKPTWHTPTTMSHARSPPSGYSASLASSDLLSSTFPLPSIQSFSLARVSSSIKVNEVRPRPDTSSSGVSISKRNFVELKSQVK